MRSLYEQKRTSGVDERIAAVASRQHGVFSREQAVRLGATNSVIGWRLRVGRWERVLPRVYRVAGAPETWRQQLMAASLHLGPTAVASHRAAGVISGLLPTSAVRIEMTVPRSRHRARPAGWTIHWATDPIPREDLARINGIPITKPARTLLDLAASEHAELVERCLDEALRRRSVSLPFLEWWLADPRRLGHRGARVIGPMIEARGLTGVTESPLESDLLKLLRRAGLPIPMLQYVVRDGGRPIARLDFAYPEQLVAIEADGFRHHDTRGGFDRERARGNELLALGWQVLRVTSAHLRDDPHGVVSWVRAALADRSRC